MLTFDRIKTVAIYASGIAVGCLLILISILRRGINIDKSVLSLFIEQLGFAIVAAVVMAMIMRWLDRTHKRIDKYSTTIDIFESYLKKSSKRVIIYNTWMTIHLARLIKEAYIKKQIFISITMGSYQDGSFLHTRVRQTEHKFLDLPSNVKLTNLKTESIINPMKDRTKHVVNFLINEEGISRKNINFYTGFSPAMIARIDNMIFWSVSPIDDWNVSPGSRNVYCAPISDPKGHFWYTQLEKIRSGKIGYHQMTHDLDAEKIYLSP